MDIGKMRHKEYGSDFYFPIDSQWLLNQPTDSFFLSPEVSLFFSGRTALHSLLFHGITTLNWKEVYLPSYYCHEVYRYVKDLPIKFHYYPFNPSLDAVIDVTHIPNRVDCVLVIVSYFGMLPADTSQLDKCVIIEDTSHNLQLCKTSEAQYCFGSLRKELPVPVGGFCYSPKGLTIPNAIQKITTEKIAKLRTTAMQLKFDYIQGNSENKSTYRKLFNSTENHFKDSITHATMAQIAMDILAKLDIVSLLQQKEKNLQRALIELVDCNKITLLGSDNNRPSFGLVLQCETQEEQASLAQYLIKHSIFPTVLWPEQSLDQDKTLENTLLFLHVDFRYNTEDIAVITQTIKSFFAHA